MFVLGASFIGADHNVGSLTTQLLYEPRRWRVHAGKSGAALAGCAAVTLLSLGFLVAMALLGANLNGITDGVDREFLMNRLGQIGRITVAGALGGGMAYGVTLVLRRTSAGIVVFFLQYPLMFLVSPESEPLGVFSRILPLRGLVAFVLDPSTMTEAGEDIGIRTLAGGVGLTLVWIVVILAASGRLFSRAEIR
jgi:ABC-type transport system involved in multi-copper enzyme maturation permease subunit